ncbi:hypothetical protein Mapa_016676 [Marchantia paleacea]|nr:hypothetical protein Mapa_016676 [Marchantia paleacea]
MGAGPSAPRSRESGPSVPGSRGSVTAVSGSQGLRRSKSWAVVETSKLGDRSLSSSFKVQLQCALHEFGTQRGCRSENYLQQRGFGALVGIHSNWIGHFILAAARPTNRLLEEHHLIYQLHSQHIGAVINLQEAEEHSGCGEGLARGSAFSYNPERFMENHGRTGVVIGCYFVYSGAYEDPAEAIQAIRTFRHGTFKSTSQVQVVKDFEAFLLKLRVNFIPPDKFIKRGGDVPGYPNILEHMTRQKKALHGLERRALLYVPKIIDWITRELIRRTDFNRQKREKIAASFMLAFTTPKRKIDIAKAKDKINVADWGGVEEMEVSTLCHLLLGWLRQLQEPIVPDTIATAALSRGDIEAAIDELAKADKISFATVQILACFIFQVCYCPYFTNSSTKSDYRNFYNGVESKSKSSVR